MMRLLIFFFYKELEWCVLNILFFYSFLLCREFERLPNAYLGALGPTFS